MERPSIVKDEHLEYLDDLRSMGDVNMMGASPYLSGCFKISKEDAKIIVKYWMETFSERHPEEV